MYCNVTPRDILNKIKWTKNLRDCNIWYIHRGAPNNTRVISGEDITKLGKGFMELGKTMIPYHRITKITFQSKVIWEKKKSVRK